MTENKPGGERIRIVLKVHIESGNTQQKIIPLRGLKRNYFASGKYSHEWLAGYPDGFH